MIKKQKLLITAGPTREYIDPVRYISNDSTGKMGFAIAEAAAHLDCDVTLIAGPVNLETPKDIQRIDIVSAADMHDKMMKIADKFDIIIMAAAISDFTPCRIGKTKIKKTAKNVKGMSLKLKRTPDILEKLCKVKRSDQTIVGFALETTDLIKNAKKKLKSKSCDWIIANSAKTIGSDENKATLLSRDGDKIIFPKLPKFDLAILLLSHILA